MKDYPDFKMEAIVTLDANGQMVLPKSVREKAGFEPDGKIALLSLAKDGELCCLLLIKAEKFDKEIKRALSLNSDLK